MTEKMIRDAYARIRTIDQTIPDDVLDFMKDASIEKLNSVNKNFVLADVSGECLYPYNAVRSDKITELSRCSICKKEWY